MLTYLVDQVRYLICYWLFTAQILITWKIVIDEINVSAETLTFFFNDMKDDIEDVVPWLGITWREETILNTLAEEPGSSVTS